MLWRKSVEEICLAFMSAVKIAEFKRSLVWQCQPIATESQTMFVHTIKAICVLRQFSMREVISF